MLADVLTTGTGTGVRAAGFRLPAAGKTGTTDDYSDAWFIGYTPNLLAGVWFGMDKPESIMSRGFAGVVAVPAWAAFMKKATKGDRPTWPLDQSVRGLEEPTEPPVFEDLFPIGSAPSEICPLHNPPTVDPLSVYERRISGSGGIN